MKDDHYKEVLTMKHLDLTQKFLANLGVLFVKLHNIHWNVVGKHFMRIHTYTEELYDQVFEDFMK